MVVHVETPLLVAFSIVMLIVVIVIIFTVVVPMFRYGILNVCYGNLVADINDLFGIQFEASAVRETTLDPGECVAALSFVNTEDLRDIYDGLDKMRTSPQFKAIATEVTWIQENINCDTDEESHIVIMPALGETKLGGFWTWFTSGYLIAGFTPGLGGRGLVTKTVVATGVATVGKEYVESTVQGLKRIATPPICKSLEKPIMWRGGGGRTKESGQLVWEPEAGSKYCLRLAEGADEYEVVILTGECEKKSYEDLEAIVFVERGRAYDEKEGEKAKEDAIREYKNLLRKYPNSKDVPYAFFRLGILYREVERYDKSLESYNALIEHHKDYDRIPEAYYGRALTMLDKAKKTKEKADYASALDSFKEFIDKYPQNKYAEDAKAKIKEICETEQMKTDKACTGS